MGSLISKPKAPKVPQSIIDQANAPVPAPPPPLPVTPLPDAGSITGQAQNRRKAAVASNKSGRLSTILDDNDTLG